MKITKSQLRQIIKEQLEEGHMLYPSDMDSSREQDHDIDSILKSLRQSMIEMQQLEDMKTYEGWLKKLIYMKEDIVQDLRQAKRWNSFED